MARADTGIGCGVTSVPQDGREWFDLLRTAPLLGFVYLGIHDALMLDRRAGAGLLCAGFASFSVLMMRNSVSRRTITIVGTFGFVPLIAGSFTPAGSTNIDPPSLRALSSPHDRVSLIRFTGMRLEIIIQSVTTA